MNAIVLDGFGGTGVMHLADAPMPAPARGQVRVKVAATSVNRADTVQRRGLYPPPPGESDILGLEVAGTVDALGENTSGWREGDRVMGLVAGGGYAEYALAYADHLMPVPASLSFETAAAIPEVYITAYLNLFLIGDLKPGGRVLLHGGGGGVNTAGIQLCRTLLDDCQIIVTASTGKLERVRQLGADHVIDYGREDFAEEVKAATRGKGVDLILDHIGASYLARNQAAMAVGGRLVVIGLMGGAIAEVNLGLMMVKRQRIIGSVLRALPVGEKARITAAFAEQVLPHIDSGAILPLIHKVFPLAEAARAHEEMEASRHFGKIVLVVR